MDEDDIFPQRLYDIELAGEIGELIQALRPISMFPPWPWGHALYADAFFKRCADLPGDFIEFGVGNGGLSIFFGHIAKRLGKKVYSLDSWEGLPAPDDGRDNPYFEKSDYASEDGKTNLLEGFRRSIRKFDLEDTIIPLKGWFEDTLKQLPPDARFAFVHIDADIYPSTLTALNGVYDKVVDGGLIAFDDFLHPAQGPKRAAADFFNLRKIYPTYHVAFPIQAFLFKGETRAENDLYGRVEDGNIYSFEFMRGLGVLTAAVKEVLKMFEPHEKKGRQYKNCKMFYDLLRAEPSFADYFTYLRSMEGFFETAGGHFERRPRVMPVDAP